MSGKRLSDWCFVDICEKTEAYQQKWVGLGAKDFRIGICIGNFPSSLDANSFEGIRSAADGELAYIVEQTGNHWRKVFNICAKIGFGLWPENTATWQQYRDELLLQQAGTMSLLFSSPVGLDGVGFGEVGFDEMASGKKQVLLVLGKQYCQELYPDTPFLPVGEGFYQHPELPVYRVPYFDYRQLPNNQLDELILLLQQQLMS